MGDVGGERRTYPEGTGRTLIALSPVSREGFELLLDLERMNVTLVRVDGPTRYFDVGQAEAESALDGLDTHWRDHTRVEKREPA